MSGRREKLCAAVLAAVILLIFTQGLFSPFMSDDPFHIVKNPYVKFSPLEWPLYFFDRRAATSLEAFQFQIYRPAAVMASSAVFHVFGMKAFWFHAVNLSLHAVNALLIFRLLVPFSGLFPASAAALLFGLHPANVETVALAAGISSTLSLFFALLALGAYAGRKGAAAVSALTLCALFSRETAVMLPPALWLYDLALKRKPEKKTLLAAFLCALIYLALRGLVVGNAAHQRPWGFGFIPNLDMVFRTVFMSNLPSLFFPLNTHPLFCGLPLSGRPLAEISVFAAAAAAAVFFWRKYWDKIPPPTNFGLLWLLLSLIPTSNIVPLQTAGADRFLYSASAGLAVAAAPFLRSGWAAVSLCAFFAWQSVLWQAAYKGDAALLAEIYRRHPDDYIVNINAAYRMPDRQSAERALRRALKTAPVNFRTVVYMELGRVGMISGDYKFAAENYSKSLEEDPANWRSMKGAALAYRSLGKQAAWRKFIFLAGFTAFSDKSNRVKVKLSPDGSYGGVEVVDRQNKSELPLPPDILRRLLPVLEERYK